MAPQKIDIQWLTADIQGNVRALAWHPLKENVLSFSTDKSRVRFSIAEGSFFYFS